MICHLGFRVIQELADEDCYQNFQLNEKDMDYEVGYVPSSILAFSSLV